MVELIVCVVPDVAMNVTVKSLKVTAGSPTKPWSRMSKVNKKATYNPGSGFGTGEILLSPPSTGVIVMEYVIGQARAVEDGKMSVVG